MTVGWYVHHHGAGHAARLAAVRRHLPHVVALTSADVPGVPLPPDTTDAPRDPTANGALHWAPLGHRGHRRRMATIARWIDEHEPGAFVADVSVEVALLARLHGVPTVVVAQRGRRHDAPHALGYRAATAVVAPWTEATHLDGDAPLGDVRFTGALSRFDDRSPEPPPGANRVLLIAGAGGHALRDEDVRAAIAATPDWEWHVTAPGDDVWERLRQSDVVVGTGGGNVVAEVAAARRSFVCLPQERPFAEQHRQADALEQAGLADVHRAWPAAEAWPAILAAARERDPDRWSVLHDGRGAARLAAAIAEVAA